MTSATLGYTGREAVIIVIARYKGEAAIISAIV
jgi:hypothetical protein